MHVKIPFFSGTSWEHLVYLSLLIFGNYCAGFLADSLLLKSPFCCENVKNLFFVFQGCPLNVSSFIYSSEKLPEICIFRSSNFFPEHPL
jgi:hypothetical protein